MKFGAVIVMENKHIALPPGDRKGRQRNWIVKSEDRLGLIRPVKTPVIGIMLAQVHIPVKFVRPVSVTSRNIKAFKALKR